MANSDLVQTTDRGLYCPAGDFYIDPWRPVPRAVLTHAHADHARPGSGRYLAARQGEALLRARLGDEAVIDTAAYGETLTLGGVRVSLWPAGHVLGSAQVRLERRGEVWVVSGDYKRAADPTCAPLEPQACHTFVSECTFGLPIYQWPRPQAVFARLNEWWRENRERGLASLLFAYALGKSQRLLAGIDASLGPIYCHGAVEAVNRRYREAGVRLPETEYAGRGETGRDFRGALVVAPPSARATPWMRKFPEYSAAFASGWMILRGTRRRRAVDRGFVLSDHADWPGLNDTIRATGAERVLLTHGTTGPMARWLREQGLDAAGLETPYEGEEDEAGGDAADEEASFEGGRAGESG